MKKNKVLKYIVDFSIHRKKTVSILVCLIVFITTYALILPAITVERNEVDMVPGLNIMPAQRFVVNLDEQDTTVVVEAEENVFPLETSMTVTALMENTVAQPAESEQEMEQETETEIDTLEAETAQEETAPVAVTPVAVTYGEDELDLHAVVAGLGIEPLSIKAFDISFADNAGRELEPAGEVTVFLKDILSETENGLAIVHVNDDGKADMLALPVVNSDKGEISFRANAFSVYALVETAPELDIAALEPEESIALVQNVTNEDGKIEAILLNEPADSEPAAENVETETVEVQPIETQPDENAQVFQESTENVTVTVTAQEGAFPEGTSMVVTEVAEDTVTNAVTDAVAEADKGQVVKVQAVDITFVDENGETIEPEGDISVTLAAEDIGAEEEPVVVQVTENETSIVDDAVADTDAQEVKIESAQPTTYAIAYTVDFHWEVNGETYDFSIPGGGFVSFEHVVEVLGISNPGAQSGYGDENETKNGEIEDGNGENTPENDVYNAGEETGVEDNSANGSHYEESISLNNVEVSEATKKFVADVVSVEFSSPELVWVGKVDEPTTVGGLKEANGLEVQYSAELTEEQIAEINSSTVEAGDWALISLLPFTSEESLTVTMKNGDQFVVKVTDAQISTHVITADGEDYIITVTYGPEAAIPDGATLEAEEILEGTEAYDSYISKAMEALRGDTDSDIPEYIHDQVAFARFFDISILSEGREIEPEAPVSVNIIYAGKVMSEAQDMEVVHFAESGIEVLNAEAGVDEEKTSIRFDQSSFSVTGTIVNYRDINAGEYYIVHPDNAGHWYALAHNGTYVDVTGYYNDASSSISGYSNSDSIAWEVSTSGNGYVIKAKGENIYITLNDTVTGSSSTVLQLHSGSSGSKNTKITIDDRYQYAQWISGWFGWGGHWEYSWRNYQKNALGWQNGYVANSATSYVSYDHTYYNDASATDVQFAKLSEDSEVLPGNYPNNTYNEAQLEKWLEQALNKNPLKEVSKIGYVSDYDNRIYKIDFSAKSGVLAMASDLSLAFVTDVSNSMLFPSKLTPVTAADFTNTNDTFSGEIYLNSGNLNKLKHNNNQVYYAIGNKSGTSTVYALYYSDGWKAMDASYYARWKARNQAPDSSHEAKTIGAGNTTLSSDSSGTKYAIYNANSEYAAGIASGNIYNMSLGNMGNRLYYLEYSVDSAVKDLKTIAKEYPLGAVYVGLETFAGKNDNDSVKTRVPYTQIGGLTNTSGSSYDDNYQTLYDALKSIEGKDGTRQDVALSDSTFFGTYNDATKKFSGGYINSGNIAGTKKYVVLITDGAPNPADKKQNVIEMANRLKAAGINVITIGLSVEDVTIAPEMLWKSASSKTQANPPDSDRDRLFYWAKSGDDLTWILRDIVRSVMKEATVSATITDEIDDLFYPVDIDGKPLGNGDWIDINGKKVSSGDSSRAGKITYNNTTKTYTVTWQNQDASWNGWNGSIYVKAKEDFMGGNNVNTNVQASVVPESYTVDKGTANARTGTFSDSAKQAKKVEPATPYVNVDELHLTQNNTEWTVYLGTEVDPEEQLTKLWNNVKVNTVVKTNGMNSDYTINDKDKMYYTLTPGDTVDDPSPESGVETIDLSHYIPASVLTNLLNNLQDNQATSTVTSDPIPYTPYGQGQIGNFTVSISKTVNEEAKESAPEAHDTEKVGDNVESYTLTINYVPLTEAARKEMLVEDGKIASDDSDYQHHGGRSMEKAALEAESDNFHVINVFAKGLHITKTTEDYSKVLTGAKFVLYRTARNTDDASKVETVSGLDGSWYPAATLDCSSDGTASLNAIEKLKDGESYYLVETEVPAGYIRISPIPVMISTTDYYIQPTGSTNASDKSTTEPSSGLYDLEQMATLSLNADSGIKRTSDATNTTDLTHSGITASSDNETMYYRIANNPGVELPATGGPGTTALYLLGIMLTAFAGAGLVMRKRRKKA